MFYTFISEETHNQQVLVKTATYVFLLAEIDASVSAQTIRNLLWQNNLCSRRPWRTLQRTPHQHAERYGWAQNSEI